MGRPPTINQRIPNVLSVSPASRFNFVRELHERIGDMLRASHTDILKEELPAQFTAALTRLDIAAAEILAHPRAPASGT